MAFLLLRHPFLFNCLYSTTLMFIDIACNITCENLSSNIEEILNECRKENVMPIFVGLDIESSVKCLELARSYNTCCFQGIHPNHIEESKEGGSRNLCEIFNYTDEKVVGIGECGLDYYRSQNRSSQLETFKEHLLIPNLPYFYHCRNATDSSYIENVEIKAFDDFCKIAHPNGVVHSFDGTMKEAEILLSMGFYIGINGCSLKTVENINVVKYIPLNRILLETDSPYCQIRKSHASSQFVTVDKSKFNTPANIKKIAEAISKIKGISIEEIESIVYENTIKLFPKIEKYTSYWRS